MKSSLIVLTGVLGMISTGMAAAAETAAPTKAAATVETAVPANTAAPAENASPSFEPQGAYDDGGIALVREDNFAAIEAAVEKALADFGITATDRIAYIKVVRHNERELSANSAAPLREEVLFLGRAADDYRKPPVTLKNGPTVSELNAPEALVKIQYNPACRLKKVGSKYKLVPSGCDN